MIIAYLVFGILVLITRKMGKSLIGSCPDGGFTSLASTA
jgi:hypothetical protein